MDMAKDDMPRYAKARDEVSFVVVIVSGRHHVNLGKEEDMARYLSGEERVAVRQAERRAFNIPILII